MNYIDTAVLRLMIESASANLKNKRKAVDDLNVFPVPDGDTGTNMSLTFGGAAADTLEYETENAGVLVTKLASAALRNARGNSGVILSQIIRGFAKGIEGRDAVGVNDLKNALDSARKTAYRAVMKPTEGTILTVIREIAEFANDAADFDDIGAFLRAVLDAGHKSLAGTTELLPALKQAGVVDAGGMGLITLFEGALFAFENGKAIESGEAEVRSSAAARTEVATDIRYLYCTEFIINKNRDRLVTQFRSAISEKGDCMLVIDDEEIVKVHIHTNHPGYVIEQALKLGELTNLKIDNMKYQHNERTATETKNAEASDEKAENKNDAANSAPEKKFGFVAVSAGAGLSEIFRSLAVDEIVEGGQTMNPSTQELLDSVEKIPAETVFVLPNNKNIILAAEQIDALTEKEVVVIPTVNIPEGIAAMMAFDESVGAKENAAAMNEIRETVLCGQVTNAARDTVLDGVEIHEGDCLAVCGKDITDVVETPEKAALALAARLIGEDSAVVAVYYGEDTDKEEAEALGARLEECYPELDVAVYYGGQPVYGYIISVE